VPDVSITNSNATVVDSGVITTGQVVPVPPPPTP
jgi:hypothetical protein